MKDQNPYSVGEQPTFGGVGLQGPKFDSSVRTMQIMAAALMMGVLVFLLVVLVITQGEVLGRKNPALISVIAAGFGFLMIVNHFVIPGIISRGQLRQVATPGSLRQDDEKTNEKVLAIFQIQLIIGLAMLEGAAFFNLIALMIDRSVLNLGIFILLMGLMLAKFPTRNRVLFWVQDRVRELQMM
jgi:hypothetical protein